MSWSQQQLPPYTVYKSKHLYDTWMQGVLNGSGYNRNTSGWFDMCMFEAWFTDILLPYIRRLEGPKLLLVTICTAIFPSMLSSSVKYTTCVLSFYLPTQLICVNRSTLHFFALSNLLGGKFWANGNNTTEV